MLSSWRPLSMMRRVQLNSSAGLNWKLDKEAIWPASRRVGSNWFPGVVIRDWRAYSTSPDYEINFHYQYSLPKSKFKVISLNPWGWSFCSCCHIREASLYDDHGTIAAYVYMKLSVQTVPGLNFAVGLRLYRVLTTSYRERSLELITGITPYLQKVKLWPLQCVCVCARALR